MSTSMQILLRAHPVLPVMVISQRKHALPLATALVEAGVQVFEITLRSPVALGALADISREYPDLAVGAGTVVCGDDLSRAQEAGADFAISPGLTDPIAQRAGELDIALIPGVMTPADMMRAADHGLDVLKLFPAVAAGGIELLQAVYGPFPGLQFCPTGGVSPGNYLDFLALENVPCVGGSWICPQQLVEERRWPEITELARSAIAATYG